MKIGEFMKLLPPQPEHDDRDKRCRGKVNRMAVNDARMKQHQPSESGEPHCCVGNRIEPAAEPGFGIQMTSKPAVKNVRESGDDQTEADRSLLAEQRERPQRWHEAKANKCECCRNGTRRDVHRRTAPSLRPGRRVDFNNRPGWDVY